MHTAKHDLVVVGAGPGGYVAAIRAAQLGFNVAVVEREAVLGGTCLRVGCIPSKALLESTERYDEAQHDFKAHGITATGLSFDLATIMARKDRIVTTLARGIEALFRKHWIARYHGHGKLDGPGGLVVDGPDPVRIEAAHIVLATGSRVARLRGVELDGDRIGDSTTALSYPSVPSHLVLVGAGAIGLELGSVWRRLGAKVTVLEYLDRILPGVDGEIAGAAQKLLAKQGLDFRLGVRVTGARAVGEVCTVEVQGQEPIACDRVLIAVGRTPNTEGLGLESIGLATDERGRIPIDERFRTAVAGVYAIGDVVAGPMLAHKAEEEGIACVEWIATGHGQVAHDAIPSVVYTSPEIASVGATEEALVEAGTPYAKGVFPFMANGRARALGHTEGMAKVLAHKETDRILGVHILGARAGELIAEAVTAIRFGASSEDLARVCHAHPTLAEVLKEAALAVHDQAIHA